jgi:hypothetical protein
MSFAGVISWNKQSQSELCELLGSKHCLVRDLWLLSTLA